MQEVEEMREQMALPYKNSTGIIECKATNIRQLSYTCAVWRVALVVYTYNDSSRGSGTRCTAAALQLVGHRCSPELWLQENSVPSRGKHSCFALVLGCQADSALLVQQKKDGKGGRMPSSELPSPLMQNLLCKKSAGAHNSSRVHFPSLETCLGISASLIQSLLKGDTSQWCCVTEKVEVFVGSSECLVLASPSDFWIHMLIYK
ncbi:hypothetical protein EK904_014287 [Melospiza melodia maxima]|nr:hypothetical protein EK904_014287 [Melospiza melodia maxima]